jgi:hypothetical protein
VQKSRWFQDLAQRFILPATGQLEIEQRNQAQQRGQTLTFAQLWDWIRSLLQ